MNIVGSLVLFVLFIFVYLIIVEVFVTLFRITGLSEEKARFQVISMLTNSGYTTRETELVANSKIRRKLARFVMMFGYAFTVTIVSTVINIFFQFRHTVTGAAVAFIPMIIVVIVIAIFVRKSRWVRKIMDKIINKITDRFIYNRKNNQIIIMDEYCDLVIAKIDMKILPKELTNIELSKSNIKTEHGINVLLKHTKTGDIVPSKDTLFEVGDTIVVMGDKKEIKKVFDLKEKEEK